MVPNIYNIFGIFSVWTDDFCASSHLVDKANNTSQFIKTLKFIAKKNLDKQNTHL